VLNGLILAVVPTKLNQDPMIGWYIWGGLAIMMLLVWLLFYKLRVMITTEAIVAAFGVGWIRFPFSLGKIEAAHIVKNSWANGWGIRFSNQFMLLNVAGYDAVELSLHNRNRRVRIGTAEPAQLLAAIEAARLEQQKQSAAEK
jgi:hypothetical protein